MKAKTAKSLLKNPSEFSLIIRIAAFLLLLPFMIRFLRIQTLVERITPGRTRSLEKSLTMERVIYLCERLLRLARKVGISFSCLRRSIVLYHFLRAYGVPVVINFGAKWAGDALTGHSWLTLDGAVYLDTPGKVEQFVPFFSLPPDGNGTTVTSAGVEARSSHFENVTFD